MEKTYAFLPTIRKFHDSGAPMRCIVGPVGSGKTSAATWEICRFLPEHIASVHGLKHTKWVVVRNTYPELRDTTQRTMLDWFGSGDLRRQENTYTLRFNGLTVEILFRSCDRAADMAKFKSLEVTGYWIDESIEVAEDIKRMLKNRIGRFPQQSPVRFGIETTNPPDVEHPLYSQFGWMSPPPGPVPTGIPLEGHHGFWQPPRENEKNLRPGYYDSLVSDYRDAPEWIAMYIEGKPGMMVVGRQVYQNFRRDRHVGVEPLIWTGGTLYRGWDNTGLCPACVVVQVPTAGRIQVLREFWTDRDGIVDFTRNVSAECNIAWPGAKYVDYADPAGMAKFSRAGGGLTSNAELMSEAAGIEVIPAEQSFSARQQAVEQSLERYDGLLIDLSCTRLINGFIGGYHYPEIGKTGIYREDPEKNRFSHPHDALQYVVVSLTKSVMSKPTKTIIPEQGLPISALMGDAPVGQGWMS